ncbi:hypothetical protein H5410_023264 [Solanum commersonii]|uniref:Uncharacterized protein n=1 Tax=Solanum commersonii TaxID=4109 RepID=A0A9J5ZIQ8_SOLCO|nr:hypothetical protein H5410_023264 [Solanum commersonii]
MEYATYIESIPQDQAVQLREKRCRTYGKITEDQLNSSIYPGSASSPSPEDAETYIRKTTNEEKRKHKGKRPWLFEWLQISVGLIFVSAWAVSRDT